MKFGIEDSKVVRVTQVVRWYQNGRRHRDDGPDGYKYFYLEDDYYEEKTSLSCKSFLIPVLGKNK